MEGSVYFKLEKEDQIRLGASGCFVPHHEVGGKRRFRPVGDPKLTKNGNLIQMVEENPHYIHGDVDLDPNSWEYQKICLIETFASVSIKINIKKRIDDVQVQMVKGGSKTFEEIVQRGYRGKIWWTPDSERVFGYIPLENLDGQLNLSFLRKNIV